MAQVRAAIRAAHLHPLPAERIVDHALDAVVVPPASARRQAGAPARAPTSTLPADARLPGLLALYRTQFQADPEYPPDIAAGPPGDAARAAWLEQQLLPQFAPDDPQRAQLSRARAQAVQSGILGTDGVGAERVFLTDRVSGASGTDGAVRMELKLQ